jgi:hypothetical protein
MTRGSFFNAAIFQNPPGNLVHPSRVLQFMLLLKRQHGLLGLFSKKAIALNIIPIHPQ